ncbi:hypothetical protein C0J52_11807, partial [Blattella germanica]
ADRGRFTPQQRSKTVLLYVETKSVVLTQRRFRQHFNTCWTPVKNTIYRLYRQFETNEMPEPKHPRVSQIRSPENDSVPYSSRSIQRRKATFGHHTVPTSIPVITFFGGS